MNLNVFNVHHDVRNDYLLFNKILFWHKVNIIDIDAMNKKRKAQQRRANSRMAKVREQEKHSRAAAAAELKNIKELQK